MASSPPPVPGPKSVLALRDFRMLWVRQFVSIFGDLGFGIAFVIVAAQTLMQQETPPEMLGRVSSSFMSVFSFAQVFGLLLSGQLAVWLGIRQVFLACATSLGLIAALGHQRHKRTSAATPDAEAAAEA